MSKESERLNGFITGLLIGGVVGSALAMLYTPVTGKKLRRKISNKADDIIDNVNDYIEAGKEKAEGVIKESKKMAESIFEDAKKKINSN
jgi:gas vesicle protein